MIVVGGVRIELELLLVKPSVQKAFLKMEVAYKAGVRKPLGWDLGLIKSSVVRNSENQGQFAVVRPRAAEDIVCK